MKMEQIIRMRQIEGFKEITTILDNYGVDYWIDAGTLLGAVRSRTIISDDSDVDFGSYYDQFIQDVRSIGKSAYLIGYDVMIGDSKVSFRKQNLSLTVHLYKNEGENYTKNAVYGKKYRILGNILNYLFLDGLSAPQHDYLHLTFKTGVLRIMKGIMLRLPGRKKLYDLILSFGIKTGCFRYYQLKFPKLFFDRLKRVTFYGNMVCIPEFTSKYLEYIFGPNWRIPDKNWPEDGYYQMAEKNYREYEMFKERMTR